MLHVSQNLSRNLELKRGNIVDIKALSNRAKKKKKLIIRWLDFRSLLVAWKNALDSI